MLNLIINFSYLRHFLLFLWLLYVATSFASLSYIIAAVCANEVPAMMERLYILGYGHTILDSFFAATKIIPDRDSVDTHER